MLASPINQKLPVVYIAEEVYRKLRMYADLCNSEISALGCATYKNGNFTVDEIYLFEQTVTSGSTDISTGAVSKFLYEHIRSGKDPERIKFWWHSHAKMGVFWSATDEGTITRFNNGWMLSTVSNKQGNHLVRLDIYEPLHLTLNLPFEIVYNTNPDDCEEIWKEISDKVKILGFWNEFPKFDNRDPLTRRGDINGFSPTA